ncbi:molybdenum cofactor guanylyltransferase [Halovivax gelatinilyticus]|uniref:molybdenum cofactor guanylyltransferase n=1 Tax=Halovivax gelatinilyticus TaxID=2961597 RepID=UPI0020CA8ACE|nr:molybdenum cofactor guanylyltransferase [Halovivax gelatinilyticus]
MSESEASGSAQSNRAGVILAGGRSTRFGDGDKAFANVDGVAMVRRVADRLAPVVGELVVNGRTDQREGLESVMGGHPSPVEIAIDETPDRGPMGGIATGLSATDAEYAAVVACDMPFVDPTFLAYAFERARGCDGAIARLSDGWFQTTQAVYRVEPMRAACERALETGDGRILDAVETLEYAVIESDEIDDPATFANVNTREELDEAVERIRRDGER